MRQDIAVDLIPNRADKRQLHACYDKQSSEVSNSMLQNCAWAHLSQINKQVGYSVICKQTHTAVIRYPDNQQLQALYRLAVKEYKSAVHNMSCQKNNRLLMQITQELFIDILITNSAENIISVSWGIKMDTMLLVTLAKPIY